MPAAKRKGAAKKGSDSESDDVIEPSSDDEETFELSAPSPAVAPKASTVPRGCFRPPRIDAWRLARTSLTKLTPSAINTRMCNAHCLCFHTAQGKKNRSGPTPLAIKSLARMAPVPEEKAPLRARRAAAAKPVNYKNGGSDDDSGSGSDKDSDFEVLSD